MNYEKIRSLIIVICVISGALLLIMNTFVLCAIVPVIGYHLLSDEAAAVWLPFSHMFGLFVFIFVVALIFLFEIDLVQYLNKSVKECNTTKLLEKEAKIKQGGGPD